jgi:hypothetical protein
MRLTMLAMALLTSVAAAQITIPAHNNVYNGYSRGFGFTAQTAFTIVGLDLPTNAFQAGDTAAYAVRVNGVTMHNSRLNAGPVTVSIPVVPNDIVDIVGNWSPVAAGTFTAHNSYGSGVAGSGAAPYATTILGVPHTLMRVGVQNDVGNPLWTVGTGYLAPVNGQIGRIQVYVSGGTGTVLATNTSIGAGCVASYNSFYSLFSNAAAASTALSGNALILTPTANGYVGAWAPGAAAGLFVTPVAATPLGTGDDGVVAVTPSVPLTTPYGPQATLQVSGNAIIGFGAGLMDYPGTNSYTPTAAGFLNSTLGGIYAWHDYNQAEAGSGQILSEEIGGTLYITFNGVENYASPEVANPGTMQFQLDLAAGSVRILWTIVDANSTSTYGSAHLVGVTAPGASADPGSVNLATATLLTQSPEVLPLALAATSRPIIGTSWGMSTTNIPAPTLVVEIIGLSDPGINDLFFIGMPGCGLRANLDLLNAAVAAGPTHAWSFGIPNNVALLNLHLYATSAAFAPVNPFGAISSNGIDGLMGDY